MSAGDLSSARRQQVGELVRRLTGGTRSGQLQWRPTTVRGVYELDRDAGAVHLIAGTAESVTIKVFDPHGAELVTHTSSGWEGALSGDFTGLKVLLDAVRDQVDGALPALQALIDDL